jgi:hypothetical protein
VNISNHARAGPPALVFFAMLRNLLKFQFANALIFYLIKSYKCIFWYFQGQALFLKFSLAGATAP